jgi:hypothetical protein
MEYRGVSEGVPRDSTKLDGAVGPDEGKLLGLRVKTRSGPMGEEGPGRGTSNEMCGELPKAGRLRARAFE